MLNLIFVYSDYSIFNNVPQESELPKWSSRACENVEIKESEEHCMSKVIIITANYRGRKIERRAYSDFQAFTIINTLNRDGCVDIGMREEIL